MTENSALEDIKNLGRNVNRIRKSKKLSLEMLANLADIDLSGLHRIETGKTNPKLSTIFALAKALDVLPEEFFKVG